MASDLNKPNGQAVITPRMGPSFIEALAVKKFHGVGPATASKMERLGILTGADLKAKSLSFLQEKFGKSGAWYFQIARGIDERPVQPDRPRKSIGAEDTFATDIFEVEAAQRELAPLLEKVWHYCEDRSIRGRTVTLKVKFSDFQQITRSRTTHSVIDRLDFEQISGALLEQVFPVLKGVRLIGVTISNLVGNDGGEPVQLSLID